MPGVRTRAQHRPAPAQDRQLQDDGTTPAPSSTPGPDLRQDFSGHSDNANDPSPPRRHSNLDHALSSADLRQDIPHISSQPASPTSTAYNSNQSAVYDSLPASPDPTNHGRPQSTRAQSAEPQPSTTDSEPQPRRGLRVRFKPQPLVVGNPLHPYWQAHHSRPRIPPVRGEGR